MFKSINSRKVQRCNSEDDFQPANHKPLRGALSIGSMVKAKQVEPMSLRIDVRKGGIEENPDQQTKKVVVDQAAQAAFNDSLASFVYPGIITPRQLDDVSSACRQTQSTQWNMRNQIQIAEQYPTIINQFPLQVMAAGRMSMTNKDLVVDPVQQHSTVVLMKQKRNSVSSKSSMPTCTQGHQTVLVTPSPLDIRSHNEQNATSSQASRRVVSKRRHQRVQLGSKKHIVQDSQKIANRVRKLKDLLSPVEIQPQTQRSHALINLNPSSPRNLITGRREDSTGASNRLITDTNQSNSNIFIDFKIPDIATSRSMMPIQTSMTEKSLMNALFIDEVGSPCRSNRLQSPDLSQNMKSHYNVYSPSQNSIYTRLSSSKKAPMAERCDLRSLQNTRLNQMRQEMQAKVWSRREDTSLASPVSYRNQNLSVSMAMTEEIAIASVDTTFPHKDGVRTRKSSVVRQSTDQIIRMAMIESSAAPRLREDQKQSTRKINSVNQAEYNAPVSNLRPIEFADVPLIIDHIGPPTSKEAAISASYSIGTTMSTYSSKVASFKKDSNDKTVNFDPVTTSVSKLPSIASPRQNESSQSKLKTTTFNINEPVESQPPLHHSKTSSSKKLQQSPARKASSIHHANTLQSSSQRKKNFKKLSTVYLDAYGAAEDATQPQQVQAIVQFFGQLFNTGSMRAQPSKPKPRVENPRVARGSDRKLFDVLSDYLAGLTSAIKETDMAKAKQRSQIYLGSYDQNSIHMCEELDKLRSMLEKAKKRIIDEQMQESRQGFFKTDLGTVEKALLKEKQKQKDQVAIQDIVEKIQHVLVKIANRGPNVSEKLRGFISVEQTLNVEHPDHLPDIQHEGAKLLAENIKVAKRNKKQVNQVARRLSSIQQRAIMDKQQPGSEADEDKDKEQPMSNFFKPYEQSQMIVFPEQARILNKSLQIYRYEVGEGLVDAISNRIKRTKEPDEILNEIILDQNNLSDANLALILDALHYQGLNYRQSCQSINISGNEVGPLAVESLIRFFEFQSPDHLCELRLNNLRLPDLISTQLFDTLSNNVNLLKLSLANTQLKSCTAMSQLCEFLSHNDLLSEVNFSFCQLSIEQLTQIFSALRGTLSLTHLNVSSNFNEYGRYEGSSNVFFETMTGYFENHMKLVHLDLSNLNLGDNVLMLGPPLFKANCLQAVHLHGNGIRPEARSELYDIFRIRLGVRQTKTEIMASQEEEQKISLSKAIRNVVLAEECKVDMKAIEHKMNELRRDSMRLEATQFHGVGRRPESTDKLLLVRILGHQELSLFNSYNVAGWQVSPTDSCYICEGWKYTIFFYDRRRHIKNKLLDCVTRWILERLNALLHADHKRRVSPTIVAHTLIPLAASGQLQMSNTLEFVARMNRTVCYLLEQAQINATRKQCPYDILLKCYLQNKVNVADNIALSMDLDVNDLINKSLRYPDDSEIIDLPEQSNYFSREMEDDQTFIWAGFAKPGKHTVMIHDPLNLNGVVKKTFLVGVRKKELMKSSAPSLESIEEIMKQGASRLDSTILFSNWKRDKISLFDQCFKFDWAMISTEAISEMTASAASEDQLEEVQKIIKSGYTDFIKSYSILASHSSNYPLIDRPRFEVFVNKCYLLSSTLTIESCYKIFERTGAGGDLSRPQFLQAVLQLVFAKYLRPKAQEHMQRMIKRLSSTGTSVKLPSDFTISDMSAGVRHFFEKLIPKFAQKRTWQEFRVIVQKPKTSQIIINSMTVLRRCYAQSSEIVNNKRRFTIEHALQLFDYIKRVTKKHPLGKSITITNQQLMACWGLSKITVKDMDRDFDRTQHMVFVEFLEFLCRVAHVAQFSDCKPNYGSNSSCGEESVYVKPVLSESSEREESRDAADLQNVLNFDSESSEDGDFVATEQQAATLTNFTFLFHRSTMKVGAMGKKHRLKLRQLLSLLPAVLRKQAKLKDQQNYLKMSRKQSRMQIAQQKY